MEREKCEKESFIETGRVIVTARFDSKKIWKAMLLLSIMAVAFSGFALWKINLFVSVFFCVFAIVLSALGIVLGKRDGISEFEVTDKCIYRKTVLGRITYLPLNSIRAVDLVWFDSISVRTSVGKFNCLLVKNRREVFGAIKTLLDERCTFSQND